MAKTLAEKTDWLFQNVRDPEDGQSYSNARIAAMIEHLCPGFSVTPTTIWNIRTGKSDNPSWKLIEGLAKAFGVTSLYFTDDDAEQQTQEELALLAALRDAGVRSLALRAQGLSPQSLATVRELIERVRELEGLRDNRQPGI
jgi:ESX-1-secreted protein regulator